MWQRSLRKINFGLLVIGFLVSAAGVPAYSAPLSATDTAKVLAGKLNIDGSGEAPSGSIMSYWQKDPMLYPVTNSRGKNKLDSKSQTEIRRFSMDQLSAANRDTEKVLYLFGGPDFVYPDLFFPNMELLVLVGLERIGAMPVIDAERADFDLSSFQKMIRDIGTAYASLPYRSYFVTDSMDKMIKSFGVTTMVSIGIVMAGYEIEAIESVSLDQNGRLVANEGVDDSIQGVKISYNKGGRQGAVLYFQQNVANEAFGDYSNFARFIKNERIDTAFYKAASYLSFSGEFSNINSLVLENVRYIVQTDSGLPLRLLKEDKWDLTLFGMYARPDEEVFGKYSVQDDLKKQYTLAICEDSASNSDAVKALKQAWSEFFPCSKYRRSEMRQNLRWGGLLPFVYGYNGFLAKPKSVRPFSSTLIYATRR